MEGLLLGIDLGTTGTKCLLTDPGGHRLASAYCGYPTFSDRPGRAEQNPDDWWNAVVKTVRQCVPETETARRVRALSVSSQGGSLVAVDRQGKPLRRAIVWMDKRSRDECAVLSNALGPRYLYTHTGWAPEGGLNASEILWLHRNEPQTFSAAAHFLSAMDYLYGKLTGRPCLDPASAGITQLFDVTRRRWDERILSCLGIGPERLAEVASPGQRMGRLSGDAASQLGLDHSVEVACGGHDQYCVALGAGAVHSGDTLLATGTAWVIVQINCAPRFDDQIPLAQSPHTVPGLWGSIGSLEHGGASLEWLRRSWTGASEAPEPLSQIDREAKKREPGAGGLLFYPLFGGSTLPEADPFSRATFLGLNPNHDRYDLARAVMEGVAFQTKRILSCFQTKKAAGRPVKMLGGAAKSPFWSQLTADILSVPLAVSQSPDAACLGAAALAGVGAGIYSDAAAAAAALAQPETFLLPEPATTETYEDLYQTYVRCAGLLRQCYRQPSTERGK